MKLHEKKELVEKKAENLTPMQADKFMRLSEGIEYEGDAETFEKSLDIILDHHFSKGKKNAKTNLITEEIEYGPNDPIDGVNPRPIRPEMKRYVEGIKRSIRH